VIWAFVAPMLVIIMVRIMLYVYKNFGDVIFMDFVAAIITGICKIFILKNKDYEDWLFVFEMNNN